MEIGRRKRGDLEVEGERRHHRTEGQQHGDLI
jgi:hypothetical protein